MAEKLLPVSLYCDVGDIQANILLKGYKLKNGATSVVNRVCPGCIRWTDEKVREVDKETIEEWSSTPYANRVIVDREYLLGQLIIKDPDEEGFVIGMCTPYATQLIDSR